MNRNLALIFSKLNTNMQNYEVFSYPQGKKKKSPLETGSVQLCNVADNHLLSMQNALNSPAVQPQLSSNCFNKLFGQFWKESSARRLKLLY